MWSTGVVVSQVYSESDEDEDEGDTVAFCVALPLCLLALLAGLVGFRFVLLGFVGLVGSLVHGGGGSSSLSEEEELEDAESDSSMPALHPIASSRQFSIRYASFSEGVFSQLDARKTPACNSGTITM